MVQLIYKDRISEDETTITDDYKSSVNSPEELKQRTRKNSQLRPDYNGHWLALTVAEKHEQYHYAKPLKSGFKRTAQSKLKKETECSSSCMKSLLFLRLPIIKWILHYNLKTDLLGDIVAGITVAVMHIPQGMAYAMLAYIDPICGIYMAFFPVFFYAIFASSRHNSMGSFAIICLMTGNIVIQFATFPDSSDHGTGPEATAINNTTYSPIEVSTILCFGISIWMFLLGLLNLGVLSVFLSDMLVSGFTTGAAVQVLTSQLKSLFGVLIKSNTGAFNVILTWKALVEKILESNPATMVISMTCIAVLLINNEIIKPCLAKFTRIPVPIELIVVVGGTLASKYGNLNSNYGVEVVGYIPTGLPRPTIPPFDLLSRILIPSLTVAVVSFCISFSMAKIFAKRNDYKVDPTQELYATAIGNAVGSFFQCAPMSASLSRSLIQESVGGVTQLASIISCGILSLVLLFIGSFFQTLPSCVLAAIIITALKGMFLQVRDFQKMWKLSKVEASVWMVSFLGVVIIDIDIGLFLGVATSLFILIYKSQKPTMVVLARVPNTDIYLDKDKYASVNEIPKLKIIHVAGSLHFANKEYFRQNLTKIIGVDPKVICKMEAKQKKKKEKELMRQSPDKSVGIQSKFRARRVAVIEKPVFLEADEINIESAPSSSNISSFDDKESYEPPMLQHVKNIILDLSGVGHIDICAAQNLALVYKEYSAAHISLYYSTLSESCLETMDSSGALEAIPEKAFFHSIHDAVFFVNFPELSAELN